MYKKYSNFTLGVYLLSTNKKGGDNLSKKHLYIIDHTNSKIASLSNKQWTNTIDAYLSSTFFISSLKCKLRTLGD